MATTLPRRRRSLRERLAGSVRGSLRFRRKSEEVHYDWIHENQSLSTGVSYRVEYLGAHETAVFKGSEVVVDCISKIKIRLLDLAIHRISSISEYTQGHDFFGFIARQGSPSQHYIHLFKSEGESNTITLTMAQAFNIAFLRYMRAQEDEVLESLGASKAITAEGVSLTSMNVHDQARSNFAQMERNLDTQMLLEQGSSHLTTLQIHRVSTPERKRPTLQSFLGVDKLTDATSRNDSECTHPSDNGCAPHHTSADSSNATATKAEEAERKSSQCEDRERRLADLMADHCEITTREEVSLLASHPEVNADNNVAEYNKSAAASVLTDDADDVCHNCVETVDSHVSNEIRPSSAVHHRIAETDSFLSHKIEFMNNEIYEEDKKVLMEDVAETHSVSEEQ